MDYLKFKNAGSQVAWKVKMVGWKLIDKAGLFPLGLQRSCWDLGPCSLGVTIVTFLLSPEDLERPVLGAVNLATLDRMTGAPAPRLSPMAGGEALS